MKEEIFNILQQINSEGIENHLWSMHDLHDLEFSTKEYFGTQEDVTVSGKLLVLYVDVNDYYSFIRTETADLMLTVSNGTPYPAALMIWFL